MSTYYSAKNNKNKIFVIVLIMCSINFFELQIIKGSFFRYVQFGYLLLTISLSLPYIFSKKKAFFIPVQLIFISVLLSIFIATFTRNQNFIDSVGGTVPILIWGTFFYLNHVAFPVDKIENIVIGYGILYLILYLFQFTHPQTALFIKLETIDYSRGILRIVFPGRGLFYLTIFIAINKITSSKRNQILWGLISIAGIVVTVMQVTRQFIFATIFIYFIHFIRNVNILNKISVLLVLGGLIFYVYHSDNIILTNLKDTQGQNNELGSDYIRIQEAIFYITNFSESTFNRIFGNGVPYGETSDYNKYYGRLILNYGYWLSDVGIIAIYAMFGIIAVIGYYLIWLKSFFIKLPKAFYYLKYYLWFLLLTSFTSDTIYSSYDLIATVLVIHSYQIILEKDVMEKRRNKDLSIMSTAVK